MLGHFRPFWDILDHLGSLLGHFGAVWTIFNWIGAIMSVNEHFKAFWTFLELFGAFLGEQNFLRNFFFGEQIFFNEKLFLVPTVLLFGPLDQFGNILKDCGAIWSVLEHLGFFWSI